MYIGKAGWPDWASFCLFGELLTLRFFK
jgi:hypothetical protein